MRVRNAADDLLALEDALGNLGRHQIHRVVLAHGGHSVAVLHAALLEHIRVGGVAHQRGAAKAVIVEAVQPLELFGVLLDEGDVVPDALQVANQCGPYLIAADDQNIHTSYLVISECAGGSFVRCRSGGSSIAYFQAQMKVKFWDFSCAGPHNMVY